MTRAIVLAAALAWLRVGPVAAYELERVGANNAFDPCSGGPQIFWPSATVAVDVSFLQPSQFQTYANQAQQRWNQAISSFHFTSGRGNFCDSSDGITSMGFKDTDCSNKPYAGQIVSITRLFYRSDGTLIDADSTFDVNVPALTDPALFTQIAMHELGHVLGLAHSDACGANGRGTLMQAVTNLSDPRLDRPQPDDIAGALAIYPGSSSGDGTVPPGANSCAVARRAGGSSALALLFPLVLIGIARARSARRTGPGVEASR